MLKTSLIENKIEKNKNYLAKNFAIRITLSNFAPLNRIAN